MLYLVTDPANTATWIYVAEVLEAYQTLPPGRRIEVLTAFAADPDPMSPMPPRPALKRARRIARHTLMPRGGHFPFYEDPGTLLDDLRLDAAELRLKIKRAEWRRHLRESLLSTTMRCGSDGSPALDLDKKRAGNVASFRTKAGSDGRKQVKVPPGAR